MLLRRTDPSVIVLVGIIPRRGIFGLLSYPQHPVQCLARRRCSIHNLLSEWMNEWSSEFPTLPTELKARALWNRATWVEATRGNWNKQRTGRVHSSQPSAHSSGGLHQLPLEHLGCSLPPRTRRAAPGCPWPRTRSVCRPCRNTPSLAPSGHTTSQLHKQPVLFPSHP